VIGSAVPRWTTRDELAAAEGNEVGFNVRNQASQLDSQLVADNVAHQLAQRISFRAR